MIKIWEVTAGQIISFLYESGKNRKVLILKVPIEINDKKVIDEIDKAMEVISRYIIGIINDSDDNADIDKHEIVNDKELLRDVSDTEKFGPLNDIVHDSELNIKDKGSHEEANDKMNLLFQKGNGIVGKGPRYLVDINAEKDKKKDSGVKDDKRDNFKKDKNDQGNMVLLPKKDVIKTRNTSGSKMYNEYEVAFQHVIPEIIDAIKKNNNDIIISNSDVVKELGKNFEKKTDVSIYMGIRHILFNHGIRVIQCTLKEIDPVTKKGKKGLRLRMFEKGDPLPCSIKRLKKYR